MSLSDWTLIGGFRGPNFPDNFSTPANDAGVSYGVLNDPKLMAAIGFTLKYTAIVTVVLLGLALLIALLVQEATRWNSFLRTAILVPSALGLASASLLFYGLYTPSYGPLNPILMSLGIIQEPISFIGTPDGALWSTVVLIIWRYTGFYMLILLVGLQAIPTDIYEAARIDGASRLADLPHHHHPTAAVIHRPHGHPLRDRISARVRPVLHPHQGRPGRLDHDPGAAHLLRGVRTTGSGRGRRVQRAGAARPRDHQRRAVPCPASEGLTP